jgi:hypothetical protein
MHGESSKVGENQRHAVRNRSWSTRTARQCGAHEEFESSHAADGHSGNEVLRYRPLNDQQTAPEDELNRRGPAKPASDTFSSPETSLQDP